MRRKQEREVRKGEREKINGIVKGGKDKRRWERRDITGRVKERGECKVDKMEQRGTMKAGQRGKW